MSYYMHHRNLFLINGITATYALLFVLLFVSLIMYNFFTVPMKQETMMQTTLKLISCSVLQFAHK